MFSYRTVIKFALSIRLWLKKITIKRNLHGVCQLRASCSCSSMSRLFLSLLRRQPPPADEVMRYEAGNASQ